MKKKEMIDYLIENGEFSGWTEEDRAGLEENSEGGLARLVALADRTQEMITNAGMDSEMEEEDEPPVNKKKMAAARKSKMAKNAKDGDADELDDDEQRLPNGKKVKGKNGKITGLQQILQDKTGKAVTNEEVEEDLEAYLEKAPAACKEYITNAVRRQEEERAELVEYIFNHESNWFERSYLENLELAELQGIVAIADGGKGRIKFQSAGGSGYQSPLRNQDHDEEPLVAPTLDWSAK